MPSIAAPPLECILRSSLCSSFLFVWLFTRPGGGRGGAPAACAPRPVVAHIVARCGPYPAPLPLEQSVCACMFRRSSPPHPVLWGGPPGVAPVQAAAPPRGRCIMAARPPCYGAHCLYHFSPSSIESHPLFFSQSVCASERLVACAPVVRGGTCKYRLRVAFLASRWLRCAPPVTRRGPVTAPNVGQSSFSFMNSELRSRRGIRQPDRQDRARFSPQPVGPRPPCRPPSIPLNLEDPRTTHFPPWRSPRPP